MPNLTKQSRYRKKMYDVVHDIIGRNLTPEEHEQMRNVVREYLSHCDEYARAVEALHKGPLVHKLVCKDCSAAKTVTGHKEFKNAYKGKRRGFVAE